MRRLWNFAVVSWSYPAQGKGGEIQRVEVQVVGQAPLLSGSLELQFSEEEAFFLGNMPLRYHI